MVRGLLPNVLWWFRWGAMFTFLTGWTIVITHMVTGTGSMPYYALILTGGTLGTFMWYNVWFVIMPRQRLTIASAEAVAAGGQANPEAAKQAPLAGRASRTNTLFSIPMLFFMGAARHLALVHSEVPATTPYLLLVLVLAVLFEANIFIGQRDDAEAAGHGVGHDPHRARADARTLARHRSPALARAGLLALACALYLFGVARANFVSDDAFIAFRYARNLARGLGLVWNPGERVEGYSDFLLVVVLAGFHRLGADLVLVGRALSALAGVACVVLTGALARRLLPGAPLAAAGAALVVAANPYVTAWGGAGLETTEFAALAMGAALPVTGRPLTARRFALASALALALALTRPEGVAVYVALTIAVFASARGELRERLAALAPGAALFAVAGAAYFAWRVWYFGDWLPNTFYAKSGFTARHALRGLGYLWGFAQNWFVWLEAAARADRLLHVVAAGRARRAGAARRAGRDRDRRRRRRSADVPLPGAGDSVPGAARRRRRERARPAPLWRSPRWGCVCALSFFPRLDVQYMLMVEQRDFEIPAWRAAGQSLGKALAPDALVAAVPIGALGWYSDLPILDMVGLTDRAIARAPIATGSGWAGHEKHDGAYVLARKPDAILLGNILVANARQLDFAAVPHLHEPVHRRARGRRPRTAGIRARLRAGCPADWPERDLALLPAPRRADRRPALLTRRRERAQVGREVRDVGREERLRGHQVAVALGRVARRVLGLHHARAHQLERAARDRRADRAVLGRVRVVAGGAVGRVRELALLDRARLAARLAGERANGPEPHHDDGDPDSHGRRA